MSVQNENTQRRELGYGEIVKHIATLSTTGSGGRYTKEINLIKWVKSGKPAVDIRVWDNESGHARKGITLTDEETVTACAALTAYIGTWTEDEQGG